MRDDAKTIKNLQQSYYLSLEQKGEGSEEQKSHEQYDIANRIQDYLDSCYFLSVSPLRDLRKVFPQYEWVFHPLEDRARVRGVVTKSDFIWRTNWWDEGAGFVDTQHVDLVTATSQTHREPLKLFFAGKRNASEASTDKINFVRWCGGEPLYVIISNK